MASYAQQCTVAAHEYWAALEEMDGALTLRPVCDRADASEAEQMLAAHHGAPACAIVTTAFAAVLVGMIVLAKRLGVGPELDARWSASYSHVLRQIEEAVGHLGARAPSSAPLCILEAISNDAALRVLPLHTLTDAAGIVLDNTLLSLSVPWEAWRPLGDHVVVAERMRPDHPESREHGLLFGPVELIEEARGHASRLGFAVSASVHTQVSAHLERTVLRMQAAAKEADALGGVLRAVRPDAITRIPHDVMSGAGWPSARSSTIFVLYPNDAPFEAELAWWKEKLQRVRGRSPVGAASASQTTVRGLTAYDATGLVTNYVRIDVGVDGAELRSEIMKADHR